MLSAQKKKAYPFSNTVLTCSSFILFFAFYLFTLNPSLSTDDTPETITAGWILGVAHPPGYPLHALMSHFFTFLNLGNPSLRLNLFAAFFSAASCALFTLNLNRMVLKIFKKKEFFDKTTFSILLFLSTSIFAFSPAYWNASLSAKGGIYVLQIFLNLAILLCVQLAGSSGYFKRSKDSSPRVSRPLLLAFFFFGLSLCNHWETEVLLLPAILVISGIYFIQTRGGSPFRHGFKTILIFLTFFTVGLTPQLYLPLRSQLQPKLNFATPTRLKSFYEFVTRSDARKLESKLYGKNFGFDSVAPVEEGFSKNISNPPQTESNYVSNLTLDQFGELSIFILISFVFFKKLNNPEIFIFLLLATLTTLLAVLFYGRLLTPIEYWLFGYFLLTVTWTGAFLGSLGLALTINYIRVRFKGRSRIGGALLASVLIIIAAVEFLNFRDGLRKNDQQKKSLYYNCGLEILKSIGRSSSYFSETDYDTFSTLYFTAVEKRRGDITFFPTPLLKRNIYYSLSSSNNLAEIISRLLESSPPNRSTYFTFENGIFYDNYLKAQGKRGIEPSGLLLKIADGKKPLFTQKKLLGDVSQKIAFSNAEISDPSNFLMEEMLAHPFLNTANYFRAKNDLSNWDWFYDRAVQLIHDDDWLAETWTEKGNGDLQQKKYSLAAEAYQEAAGYYEKTRQEKTAAALYEKSMALFHLVHP